MPDEATILEGVRRGLIEPAEAKKMLSAAEPTMGDKVQGAARAASTGLLHSVAGTLGFPGDMANLATQGIEKLTGRKSPFDYSSIGSEAIKEGASNFFGTDLAPVEGNFNKYLKSGVEGGASLINPFGRGKSIFAKEATPGGQDIVTKGATALGGLIGIGGEAGEQAKLGGTADVGRLTGSVIPMLLASYFAMKRPALVKTAQDWLKDLGTEGLDKAAAVKRQAEQTLGSPALLSQGIEREGNTGPLSGFVEFLKTVPEGAPVRNALAKSSAKAEEVLGKIRDSLTDLMPSMETADRVAGAGRKVFENTNKWINQSTEHLYEGASKEMVDPTKIAARIEAERVAQGYPVTSKAGSAMVSNARDLSALDNSTAPVTSKILDSSGKPFVTPGTPAAIPATEAAVFKKEAQTAARLAATKDADPVAVMQKRGQAATADAIQAEISPLGSEMSLADRTHANLMQTLMDPLRKGAMGEVFPKDLVASKVWGNAGEVFSNPTKYSTADIKQIGESLYYTDKEAFPLLYKQHLMETMEKHLKEAQGRTPVEGFGKVVADIAGAPGTRARENFRETITQIAHSKGTDPSELITGAEKYMDAMRVVARDQGVPRATDMYEAGSSAFTHLLKAASFTAPLRGVGWAIERVTKKRLFEEMAESLTSDNGVETLKKIANTNMTADRIQTLIRAAMAENTQQKAVAPNMPR